MRNYSICYLDAAGRTQNSELLPFEDGPSAIDFARTGLVRSAIVEVWKDNELVRRLFREPSARVATASVADKAVRAFARADGGNSLGRWDNEGGATRPHQGASR